MRRTREEFVKRIRQFASTVAPGEWIIGGDWDHTHWGGELPTRGWIDSITPDIPVWINRLDGHMALANSAALALAKVTMETPDVVGGSIIRDPGGRPTGILKDNSMALVERIVPAPTLAQQDRALEEAMRHVAARGVTSVHHMGSWDDLEIFTRARRSGKLRTRIYAAVPLETWERLKNRVRARGHGDPWLRIGGLKGFVDGSLGSHTAAMLEPFSDIPETGDCWFIPKRSCIDGSTGPTKRDCMSWFMRSGIGPFVCCSISMARWRRNGAHATGVSD